ncbi:iws1 c-terminus protein [Babesia caballi]|uniref:Iws1 c-terminus protein n=1 Tax=Babesia caballi TaxID=5871 RepID=A0AAV4LXI5_BABCB|nr:iws1 c-terminus protein [Babesia caballi]
MEEAPFTSPKLADDSDSTPAPEAGTSADELSEQEAVVTQFVEAEASQETADETGEDVGTGNLDLPEAAISETQAAESPTEFPSLPATPTVPGSSAQQGEDAPVQKHRRLKKTSSQRNEDQGGEQQDKEQQIDDSIAIPKKAQRKKSRAKKSADHDGDFVPSSDAFDKNHLDANDFYDDEFEERRAPKKKAPTAGKLYFDEVLKRVKERKKKNVQLTAEECQLYCRQLVDRMIAAAAADVEAVQQGKPGLAKLKMLNEITEFNKPAWKNWCITEGGAVALASWITPLPDGSLPNLSVRTKVLEITLQLPFQPTDLRDNDLGRQIVALWKRPDECDSNRLLIRAIVQKWVRPMLGLATNYSEMQQDYAMSEKSSMLALDGEEKERKSSQKFSQHKTQMGSIIINQERINSKLTQMFRVIEARRKAPSKATKVNMDGALI